MTNGLRVNYTKQDGSPSAAYLYKDESWDVYSLKPVTLQYRANGWFEHLPTKQDPQPVREASKARTSHAKQVQPVRLKMPQWPLLLLEVGVIAIGLLWIELTFK